MSSKKQQRQFVGYIRVSTEAQAQDDADGLQNQMAVIQNYAKNRDATVVPIYEDVGSASNLNSSITRPGLHDALKRARELNAPLIIADASRLSRNLKEFRRLDLRGISIIDAREGRRVGKGWLAGQIKLHEKVAENIRNGSIRGLSNVKTLGSRGGNPRNLAVAQRRGTIENALRAGENVRGLANVLETMPEWQKLTNAELVDQLNRSGSRNILRKGHPAGVPWTVGSLRAPLKKANEELRFRVELRAEDFDLVEASCFPAKRITR